MQWVRLLSELPRGLDWVQRTPWFDARILRSFGEILGSVGPHRASLPAADDDAAADLARSRSPLVDGPEAVLLHRTAREIELNQAPHHDLGGPMVGARGHVGLVRDAERA